MEEDIKLLEDYLLGKKMQYESGYTYFKEFKAIENLIKEYQKLEMENQSYKDYLGYPPCYDNAIYIPKSKIEKKIEKIKGLHANEDFKYFTIEVLQKLIEEE